jgi:hypothetical protein
MRKRAGFFAISVLSLMSCSEGSQSKTERGPSIDVPALESLSPSQRAVFADGKVSTEEYLAAFDAWEACSESGGGLVTITSRDPVSGLILYGTSGSIGTASHPDLTSIEGRCYDEEFAWVDRVFQVSDPTVIAQRLSQEQTFFEQYIRPCLVDQNDEISADDGVTSANYRLLYETYEAHVEAGDCARGEEP